MKNLSIYSNYIIEMEKMFNCLLIKNPNKIIKFPVIILKDKVERYMMFITSNSILTN
jgi:hypothetical protein